jgi:two-component system phosphate regulon response regulator PhoB
MVTGCGEEDDRVRGFSLGADDYMVKPFSVAELIARVQALLRRCRTHHVVRNQAAGNIRIDREAMRVQRGGREARLTATEFRPLECLVAHAGHTLSRPQLPDRVWGHGASVSQRTIDVNVGRLRRALSRAHESNPIRTVRDFGYSFDENRWRKRVLRERSVRLRSVRSS